MKKFLQKTFLLLLTLIVGGANSAWADDVTVTFASSSDVGTGTSASGNNSISKSGITISCTGGGFAISGGAHYRLGSNSTTTISSTVGNIKSIVFNGPTGTGSNSISKFGTNTGWILNSSKGTYTWSGNAETVTVKANSGQVRPTSIVVTYTPSTVPITSISGMASSASIEVGGTTTLTPTILPANTTETVVWESSNKDVATVSAGVVTGVAPGSATITAKSPTDATIKAECTVSVNATSTVATPTFSVAAGTYNVAQSVTLSCATDDATICYTTDGTDPTSSSTVYSSAISVGQTMTIKVKAFKDGLTDSEVASATYTLKCVSPAFDPASGSVEYGTEITLVTTTDGATIYYTTNGDTPTSSSSVYTPVDKPTVSGNQTFKAIATKSGWSDSDVSSATYTFYYVITAVSNNESYGTVSGTSTITATPAEGYRVIAGDGGYNVTSGSATVVNNGNNTFTVTPSSNCTVQIKFEAIPEHTVTFSVNGNTSRTATVCEGAFIKFPTAADTPSDASEFNKTLADGKTFVGWYTAEYSHSTNAPASYVNTSTTTMSTNDVTYYAVYADVEIAEGSYTLDYNNESSLSGSTSWGSYGKTYNYKASDGSTWTIKAYKSSGMQINTGKDCSIKVPSCPGNIQSIAITCSAAKAVGFSSSDYTGSGTITYLASGTDKVSQTLDLTSKSVTTGYIVPKSGSTSITKIVVSYRNVNASNFTTDNRDAAGIAYANASVDVKLTSGYTGQVLTNTNSVSVSYSSSDETVATVSSSTGAITELLKAGTTTITATFAGNATYKPAEASYDLNVTEKTPCGLAYATGEVAKLTTDAAFTNTLTNGYSLTVSYESSDEEVATVNSSTGEVTVVGAGETTIKATFAGDEDYEAGNASYTLTVSRNTPSLSVENIEMDITTEITLASIYTTNSDGEVTINSSATSIAQITDGKLKAVGIGDAIITVSIAQSSTYAAIEKTFTVTVSSKPGVAPLAYDVGGYKLVTDASTLQAGDILLFVGTNPDTKKNFAMAGQNENNRTEAEVSISDNTISEKPAAAQEVTLEGETDAWYFNVGADAYLYAASSSSNYLKTNTKEEVSDNGKAEIGINTVNGNTTITFQGSNTKNKLQYNSSNGIFSCYSTTQKPVRFYRYNASKPYNVTIGTTGYKTIVLANDATMPSGLEAYIVTAAGEKAILTKVDKVKKNTPVILKGVPDTYTLTAIDASEYSYPSTNLLAISTNTTGNGSDGGVYVLANKTNGVGFYLWNGGSLGAGRVYLPGNKLEEAEIREFVGFLMDNETRLEDLNVNDDLNKAVYDLSGRRVVKPTKGLYIVNGKKYIKK